MAGLVDRVWVVAEWVEGGDIWDLDLWCRMFLVTRGEGKDYGLDDAGV